MKPLLFFTLLVVLFFVSCKKEDNSNNVVSGEYCYLPDSIHTYEFKTGTDSTLSGRSNFSYDAKGNIIKKVTFSIDPFLKIWVGKKYEYEFNDKGSKTLNASYKWNSNNQWIISTKTTSEYNVNNQLTKKENVVFNNFGAIDNGGRSEYILNSSGIITNESIFSWDGVNNTWQVLGKVEYVTDNSGFQVSSTGYIWDKSSEAWTVSSKGKYTTDSRGNIILLVKYSLESRDMKWHVDSILYKYDNNGREISYESYIDGLKGEFFAQDKIYHSYTPDGELSSVTYYNLLLSSIPLTQTNYTYNTTGNLSSIALYSSYRLNSLQPYDRIDYLYNSEGKLTYSVNYLVDSSKKKIKSAIYFSSKHNKQGSGININDIIRW